MQACVLMNNIQQTRIQLEKTYQSMGGSNLLEDAASILNQLQSTLNKVLDQLARQFADSISPKVDKSVQHMGKLLQDVKGGGQGQAISKSEVAAAADGILGPLMDLLDGEFNHLLLVSLTDFCRSGSLSMYAENCDKSVLKRLLKQLWRIVMNCLEKSIVLPPLNEKVRALQISAAAPDLIFPSSRRRVSRIWIQLGKTFWMLGRTLMPLWAVS